MTVERTVVDCVALTTGKTTYFGVQPQPDDGSPAPLPVVIVNRPNSTWPGAFCGTDDRLALTEIQVDYYAETAEAARRAADDGRAGIIALAERPTLTSEISTYDSESRAWRVLQRWAIADYQPVLP